MSDSILVDVLVNLAVSIVSLVIGAVGKKVIWKQLKLLKKRLVNEILRINLLAVRIYPYTDTKTFEVSIFDFFKQKFGDKIKLISFDSDKMLINFGSFYNNIQIELEKPIEDIEDYSRFIKIIIKTENPIGLGIRQLDELRDFEKYADLIFEMLESLLFKQRKPSRQNFVVCDIYRTVYLLNQKTFDLKDTDLGLDIHGTDSQLTIVSPIVNLTKAVKKYYSY